MKNSLILLFCLFIFSAVRAQNNAVQEQNEINKIAGTYMLVRADNILADGSRIQLYGDDPYGILMMDNSGHYSLQIIGANRPQFKSGDKSKGTDKENSLAIQGINTHFGTFNINMQMHTITFFIKRASFPNWEGTYQERPFMFDGHILKYIVSTPTTAGAVKGEVEWKRME
jgi:lipocalin-like protein